MLEYNQQSRTAARVRELQGEMRTVGRRLQTNRITEAEHDQEIERLQLKIQRERDRLDKVMAR